jgi:hypothetical protein
MKKIIYSIFAIITVFITKLTFALDIKGELNNITTDPEGIYQNTTFGD